MLRFWFEESFRKASKDYAYPLYRKEYPALPNRYTIHEAFCKCWEAIEAKSDDFLDRLRKSGWLATVDSILSVSSMAAQGLLQAPILIHGGEGEFTNFKLYNFK